MITMKQVLEEVVAIDGQQPTGHFTFKPTEMDQKGERDPQPTSLETLAATKTVTIKCMDDKEKMNMFHKATSPARRILPIDESKNKTLRQKRLRDLCNWKWNEVIDLDGDEENARVDEDLLDTTDSVSAFGRRIKIPQVVVHRRSSVHRVRDASV